jgi:hypothetical protein
MLIAVLTSLITTLAEVGKARATVDLFTIDGQSVALSAIEQNREEVWNWFNPSVRVNATASRAGNPRDATGPRSLI